MLGIYLEREMIHFLDVIHDIFKYPCIKVGVDSPWSLSF